MGDTGRKVSLPLEYGIDHSATVFNLRTMVGGVVNAAMRTL